MIAKSHRIIAVLTAVLAVSLYTVPGAFWKAVHSDAFKQAAAKAKLIVDPLD